ncbi:MULTISPECIES: glycerophosphodiester phosphodiesterase family protein [unclassified Spirosoma]|uniref:glycerophosphodiester phosphodiesterase family protein n=1 Tax=unclassified Spirosoma TaxID=2621999 RepID=UPI000959E91E|nr:MULTISPECIES: glycerophosphodiester phosphodiesterase family protein [unclassified Spirosoma]MBN8823682.1 glycerophosphodiester phosphodiesterase family protein [Spirosoma sp.]OJW76767.1 MAG: glycerophosphodiester phosphodiesterase [Spirosoma sp. 48-14]
MKASFLVLLISLAVVQVAAQRVNRFKDTQTIDAYFRLKPNREHPLILAHRGGPGSTDTENSITTFEKTAKKLPDAIIEMDVRLTRDSGYVLLHDPTLDRESDAKGAVAEWTLADLKKVRLKTLAGELTTQQVPTFTDILNWNKNRYMLALDVKPGTDPLQVMKVVEKHQAVHSVFVICYSIAEAQRVRDQYPTLWLAVGVNSMPDLEHFEKTPLASSGRLIALTPQRLQPTAFYERLHKLNIPCSVGTYGVGQLDEKPMAEAVSGYRELLRQGGDIITTDRPVAVAALF